MQHHATAINASPQLDGSESPLATQVWWRVSAMHIPFGAKVLFWNNPKRLDNTSGKLSPTANEGIFLGYYIQPGHDWKGEYLVAKLEAADYHVNWVHWQFKERKVGIAIRGFIFPLKAMIDSKAPKADRLEDQVIPQTPKAVPFESSLHPPQDEYEYEPGTLYQPTAMSSLMHPKRLYSQISNWPPKVKLFQMNIIWMVTGLYVTTKVKASERDRLRTVEDVKPPRKETDHRGRKPRMQPRSRRKASIIIWQQGQKEEIFTSPAWGNSMPSCNCKACRQCLGNHSSHFPKVFRAGNAKSCRACHNWAPA